MIGHFVILIAFLVALSSNFLWYREYHIYQAFPFGNILFIFCHLKVCLNCMQPFFNEDGKNKQRYQSVCLTLCEKVLFFCPFWYNQQIKYFLFSLYLLCHHLHMYGSHAQVNAYNSNKLEIEFWNKSEINKYLRFKINWFSWIRCCKWERSQWIAIINFCRNSIAIHI